MYCGFNVYQIVTTDIDIDRYGFKSFNHRLCSYNKKENEKENKDYIMWQARHIQEMTWTRNLVALLVTWGQKKKCGYFYFI